MANRLVKYSDRKDPCEEQFWSVIVCVYRTSQGIVISPSLPLKTLGCCRPFRHSLRKGNKQERVPIMKGATHLLVPMFSCLVDHFELAYFLGLFLLGHVPFERKTNSIE